MREGTDRVTIVTDQVYDERDGVPLLADLYLPTHSTGALPVVIWVHGGGWRYGDRRLRPDLTRFFAGSGFAMAAVDYRLSDRATFPAQIVDLRTAIRWVRHVAGRYGLDQEHVGLWGASAGGHLASLAGLCPKGMFESADSSYSDQSSLVQAVVCGYAPIDFLRLDDDRPPAEAVIADPQNLALPPGMRSVDPHSFESLLLGSPIVGCPDRVAQANPISYAGGAPPFLILHGLSDTTVGAHQSELLYEALAMHDNDVTLCLVEGLGHGFLNRSHLDDGPARRMTVRSRHGREGVEQVMHVTQPVFPLIEAFFRTHLSRRTGSRTPA